MTLKEAAEKLDAICKTAFAEKYHMSNVFAIGNNWVSGFEERFSIRIHLYNSVMIETGLCDNISEAFRVLDLKIQIENVKIIEGEKIEIEEGEISND